MDFYALGEQRAFEKFAIAFKSPKMRSVLEGAVDQAYANGASPLLRRQALVPFKNMYNTRQSPVFDTAREVLRASHFAGIETSKARQAENVKSLEGISLKEQLARYNASPQKRNATAIGRPRENAIKAMLTRPLQNIRDPQQLRSGRDVANPRIRNSTRPVMWNDKEENQDLTFLLNDIHEARHGRYGDIGAAAVIDSDTLSEHNAAGNTDLLRKYAPKQLMRLKLQLKKYRRT